MKWTEDPEHRWVAWYRLLVLIMLLWALYMGLDTRVMVQQVHQEVGTTPTP